MIEITPKHILDIHDVRGSHPFPPGVPSDDEVELAGLTQKILAKEPQSRVGNIDYIKEILPSIFGCTAEQLSLTHISEDINATSDLQKGRIDVALCVDEHAVPIKILSIYSDSYIYPSQTLADARYTINIAEIKAKLAAVVEAG